MADYPFRVNLMPKNGEGTIAFYTSSLVTDADVQVSASLMVEKINLMPSASYEDGVVSGSSTAFAHKFGGGRNLHLSCSVSDANVGTISFIDKEVATDGGLDFYTFFGTKVCSVLGLPEGIPIFTENFKLSDSSTDPDNYISGKVISDAVAIKDSFKMSPKGRVRSNLVWDQEFGEGLLQWVSGSENKLAVGYDNTKDAYQILHHSGTDTTNPLQISGSVSCKNQLTATALVGSTVTATGADGSNAFLGDQLRPRTAGTELTLTHLSASGADNGTSTLINGQSAPIGTGGSVRIQGGASYLSQAAGGNVELIPGVGGDGSSANNPGYVHLTSKNAAGSVLRLGDATSDHENWISIRAQNGAETDGSGITWYETGTFSVSAPQYGAKIVYDEDSDDFHLGTMNNNTFFKQITIPRGTRAVEIFGHCQPQSDNVYDLGNSSFRWDDVRATNGTIQTSDRNLKTQISGSDLGLGFINDLNPVKYQWLSKSRSHYGLIAQEVSSSLAKSSVHTDNFAGYVENRMFVSASVSGSEKDIRDTADWEMENFTAIPNPELSLRYNEFLSPMIKAIQELSSQVETLKAQISGSSDFNALKTTLTDNG